MTIRKLSTIFYLVTGSASFPAYPFIRAPLPSSSAQLNHAQEVRYASFVVADKLRQSIR